MRGGAVLLLALLTLTATGCKVKERVRVNERELRNDISYILDTDSTKHKWIVTVETIYNDNGTKKQETRKEFHTEDNVSEKMKSTIELKDDFKNVITEKPDATVNKEITKTTSNIKWIVLSLVAFIFIIFTVVSIRQFQR